MREATPTLEDILAASRVVARLAADDRDALALAWAIRKRARAMNEGARGGASVSAAARRLAQDARGSGGVPVSVRRLLRAAAIVCSVWADMAPDPIDDAARAS